MNLIPASVPQRPAHCGALFDWDGVVIDSREHHEASWERLAAELGRPLPEGHFLKGFGRKNEFIIPEILHWTHDPGEIRSISLRKEELYREVVRERGLQALPGVEAWLQTLRKAGVPCAIGSSTHRANLDLSLDLIGLSSFFEAIVTAEDVQIGKPDPQVFLMAAHRLGMPPDRCVVFEDAHVGIAAARAGGMRVVGVATTHRREELGEADLAVDRLDTLDLSALMGWFPAR
jgi:beta-phosphoglucomutase family hydrolase